MKTKGIPVVISSPSGGGKTTLIKLALKRLKGLTYSISATTRPPSAQEKHGKSYFFMSKSEFLKKKKSKKFVETAVVHGHYYGTLHEQLEKKLETGKNVVLDIDVVGALNVKKKYPQSLLIFVVPPSMKILADRLRARHRDLEKDIAKRLRNARKEMKYRKYYDYIIINDSLEEAFEKLKKIYERETCRH
ncbi:MAG: guanylate kinase [Elusimicrobia bacterium]|nr:guanylate kinase [Elusimicrobiota bacterium]